MNDGGAGGGAVNRVETAAGRGLCGQCGGPVRYVPLGDLAGVIEQHDDAAMREAREIMDRLLKVCGERSICAGCKRPVFWLKTKNTKSAIFDPDGRSHWATCPHSADFKKRQARAQAAAAAPAAGEDVRREP